MKKIYLLLVLFIQFIAIDKTIAQCTTAPYGAYGSLTPTCTGAYQTVTTCGYRGEYSIITVTAGNAYSFQSSVGTDIVTITTTTNAVLAWATGTANWTATFSGQVWFYTHGAGCAIGSGCRTKRVMCAGAPPAAPANNLVCSATAITCGATLSGTTVNATNSGTGEGGSCGTAQAQPGVWYVVAGNGQTMTASLCATAWDSKISVFSGTTCSALTCIGGNDDFGPACASTSASYSWPSVSGTNYYILVHGYISTSAFSINLSCVTPPPPTVANDLVCSATAITCGATLSGTTVNATNSGTGEGGSCGTTQAQPGVWYVVAGNGQTMTASLCATAWDSKISVYSGAICSALTCIGGNDDFGPACASSSASYSWPSVVGQNYYILVHGYNANNAFSINLSCVPPPANNDCANAQSISINCPAAATTINGTTANATEEVGIADPSCDAGTIRDVWYTFNSGPNTSVNLTVTLGTANWLGGQVFTGCGTEATGLTIGGNAGNCDYNLLNPSPTLISGLTTNTIYRLRLFTNIDFDIAGTFSFTLTSAEAAPTATITASGATTFCAGQSVTLTANSGTGYTYQWNLNGSPISGATSINYTVTSSGSYTVRVTNASGCNNVTSAATVVTVNNTPDFANLQWPATATVNCGSGVSVFGKVYEPGVTPTAGADPSISVQVGVSSTNSNPSTWAAGAWTNATYNGQVANDDEYTASIGSTLAPGTYYYTFRYQIGNTGCYVYGGFQGGFWNGTSNVNGVLTVNGSTIDWANVQFPTSGAICTGGNYTVYGQVFESGVTNSAGAAAGLTAEIGVSSTNTDPSTWGAGAWSAATFNAQSGNNDEFVATIGSSLAAGTYYYAFRYKLAAVCNYQYGAINGFWNGSSNTNGTLTVNAIPTVTASATSTSVCTGQSVTLTGGGASSYSWNNGVTNGVAFTPSNTATYTVTGTTAGCSATADVTVTFNALTSSTLPTSGDYVWRGSSSSDYASVANWLQHNGTSLVAATVAPTTSNNVIIPSTQTCVLNQPSLGSNTVNSRNMTIEAGATFNMGSGTLNVGGDFTNNGTFTPGTGTVKMVGSATQDFIYGVGASHVFYNLTIDKTAGDEVVLNSHIDVTNELRITNKNFRLNSLNIDLGTTGMIMDEGPGHRIYCDCPAGYVQRTINIPANTTVDPGNLGLTITTNANAMGNTVIKRRHQRAGSNGAGELVAGTPGVYRIFDVTPQFNGGTTYPLASGGLDVDLEFQYYLDEVGSDILAQEGEFGLWRSADAGATWEPKYGTVNTTTKTIALEAWQQFSWVTGGPVDNPSALPIELVSFQANCKDDNTVSVTWVTASEHNTSHYVVEKSRDGITWSVLGQTAAAGNSTELLTYEMIDSEKASGTTYYRLTQFDNDGVFETFDPVSINCNGTTSNNHITTYPNPSLDGFYVSLFTETMEGNGQLRITDGSGRPVYSTAVNIQDGNNVFHIGDLNAAPGMYYIQVSNGTTTTHIVKHSLR